MGKIKKLPEQVIGKIAAGEVVAGPYSVVKELVENSLDAGATKVEIEIKSGGKSYIKVKDNGEGMEREDLLLSVYEHTTSKINDFDDIYNLSSFGFRGEALASIAKVSRIVITSNNGSESHRLEAIGGKIKSISEYPLVDKGTIVEVYDLFFNVPARRKFLKSDTTEKRYVVEYVEKFLLSNPNVEFIFKVDNEIVYNAGASNLEERFRLIFPEVKEYTLINGKYVEGIISSPNYHRKNRTGQIFFVQKRFVMDKMLYYIFENGYGEALVDHPYGVLFINVPSKLVDVNVHPQKLEVKFSNPNIIYSDITRTVREALKKFVSKQIFVKPINEKLTKSEVSNFETKNVSFSNDSFQDKFNSVFKENINSVDYSKNMLFDISEKNLEVKKDVVILKKRYVLFEMEDGIYIMDFHAAHERVIYEQILEKLKVGIEKVDLIIPIEIRVGKSLKQIVIEKLDELKENGFEIKVEEESIKITSIPSFLKPSEVEDVFKEIIDEYRIPSMGTKNMKHIIADKACKSAVRTGYDISEDEAKKLIEEVFKRNLTTCPHGRPLFLKLTFNEIDKYFDRT
ncbi:DNA mismatch repair protein MutL [Thermosipho japonicus]|uniref:DNA mismatch repair protein MutL n=1 Tax=Thermosipho japonicus TaxID=90323 RepID=A0A841GH51_9BACT|nr:DNA mismatch repair endonuclease MutL [Thermosipho japonicus]MBB6062942.1 DNA mismatch repair protein MutL [Thermosipho japonicus]